ncbi:mechanosensitive ion channel family protein [Candidatus Woesearchaeota archaeon]|nr:mechanosensitive ion channel family protein [Candidatus Woesearchaeota archaeon]
MVDFNSISQGVLSIVKLVHLRPYFPLIRAVITVIIILLIFNFIRRKVRDKLLAKARSKKHRSDIEIVSKFIKYIFYVAVIVAAFFSYVGSWAGLGLTAGLFSAALGWALQRPIVGIAGWLILVLKRPFQIGDHVMIGTEEGDVKHFTITHIVLDYYGREISIPNSVIFEQNIKNLTATHEFVIDKIGFKISYKSNLDKAVKIALEAAKKHTKEFQDGLQTQPEETVSFSTNGVPYGVLVEIYFPSSAKRMFEISTKISKEIFNNIKKAKGIDLV